MLMVIDVRVGRVCRKWVFISKRREEQEQLHGCDEGGASRQSPITK
ncbi:MAG: hypothetical protein K0U36_05850 [Alphaproteobacteria bacterium]|nr:hypothetical protein [Alphaproteobacteria bacterium]